MREYFFDPAAELPLVHALLRGPKGQMRATLVFDSGCGLTQVHHQILEKIGYEDSESARAVTISGVTGEGDAAYIVQVESFHTLGSRFDRTEIAGVDFSKWAHSGIEGLLGWDIIRQFHFDMDGPKGVLRVL
jgi:hypothetical protein